MASPRRVEQLGDVGDGCGAGVDVAHRGPRRLVARLGHDQLQRDLLVTEVGRRGVTELQAAAGGGGGVLPEQDPCAVVAQAAPAARATSRARVRTKAERSGSKAGLRPSGSSDSMKHAPSCSRPGLTESQS